MKEERGQQDLARGSETFHESRPLLLRLATQPLVPMVGIGLVGLADFLTGWELSFGAFYLVAILAVAQFQSKTWVFAAIFLSTLAWLIVDLHTHPPYSYPWIPYWNTGVRLLMFMAAGLLLHQVRTLLEREKKIMQFLVHDLRNPMTALSLSVQRLAVLHADPQSATILRNCEHVLQRSRDLLDALLNQARFEAENGNWKRVPFQLPQTIEAVLETFHSISEEFGIRVDVSGSGGAEVLGDPKLTERVVENIFGNALKASPVGGTISIHIGPPMDGFVQLCIADGGPGIPSHLAETVFDSFVGQGQASPVFSKGVGLGLAFCRNAVQAQGGRIWIECPLEGGVAVNITLPAGTAT